MLNSIRLIINYIEFVIMFIFYEPVVFIESFKIELKMLRDIEPDKYISGKTWWYEIEEDDEDEDYDC